jgi:CBS domain-containing protein
MSTKNAKTIKEVMSKDVKWVAPTAKLSEVAKLMQDRDCGCVLVGENDKLVGVITDRDIITRVVAKGLNPAQTEAKAAMSTKVLYCREGDAIDATIKNMAKNKVRRLLVVDSAKKMVGIVSLGDLSATSAGQAEAGPALANICTSGMKAAA